MVAGAPALRKQAVRVPPQPLQMMEGEAVAEVAEWMLERGRLDEAIVLLQRALRWRGRGRTSTAG